MTSKERMLNTFKGLPRDRAPKLGGWLACPEHICRLAGVGLDAYWEDPMRHSVEAHRRLGVDGLNGMYIPRKREDYRCVDEVSYQRADMGMSLEEAVAAVDALPEPEQILAEHDARKEYEMIASQSRHGQELAGEMLWCEPHWMASAKITWFTEYGYENFFALVGSYPERAAKLFAVGGARAHVRCRAIARCVAEGLMPPALLMGEDICSQQGPMISPDFMEKFYAPHLRFALEPLLEVGCKPVWHCDGNCNPMLDMLTDCGIQGFQGFQPECGMTIEKMAARRTREGKPLLIYGPISVTTELPCLTPDEVRGRVKNAIDVCAGNADLVLFTANTINPDVPFENLVALYDF